MGIFVRGLHIGVGRGQTFIRGQTPLEYRLHR